MSDEKPSVMTSGGNLSKTLQDIRGIVSEINGYKEDRRDINAEIQALRERAVTLGVPKAALDMAMRYMDWEPEKRAGFDLAYQLVREACGLPVQDDLFAEAERKAREAEAAERRAEADAAFADTAEKRDARRAAEANERAEQVEGVKVLDLKKKSSTPPSAPPSAPVSTTGIDDLR